MSRATFLALIGIAASALTACEQASSPLAPTALNVASSTAAFQLERLDIWGASATNRTMAATQSSGFFCALGPYGVAEYSHVVLSADGNESMVCSGKVAPREPGVEQILRGFSCVLPSGTATTDSQFVYNPSGHATLTCQSKN